MRNYCFPGDLVTVEVPAGGVSSGAGLLIGALFGVASYSSPEGASVEIGTSGVYDLAKVAGDAFAAGDKVYWDATAKAVTATATGHSWIGVATQGALASAAAVRTRLNHMPI